MQEGRAEGDSDIGVSLSLCQTYAARGRIDFS
jgi:hypothetical protein